MNTEPAWIEHDGSAVCPVPAGHDVERKYDDDKICRGSNPQICNWRCITHYRDWTAFAKEQEAMGKDVPSFDWTRRRVYELARDGQPEGVFVGEGMIIAAFARYIAAHEQPPVDWLVDVLREAHELVPGFIDVEEEIAIVADHLRQRIPNIDQHAPAATDGE